MEMFFIVHNMFSLKISVDAASSQIKADLRYIFIYSQFIIFLDDRSDMEDYDLDINIPPSPPVAKKGSKGFSRNAYPVSPRNLVVYHYVQQLMKKDQLWVNDPELYFAKILRLYYFAMNHAEIYACLRMLHAQTGMTPTKTALFSAIRDLYSKPRSLKQLVRITIYNAIKQRPALNANKLPLPASLKDYLISFEP